MSIIINFCGDLSLTGINSNNFEIDMRIKNIFLNSDINMANLEGPITNESKINGHKPVYLKAEMLNYNMLNYFNIFSLANNHILDYNKKGLLDTLAFLNKKNIKYFGVGDNLSNSYSPLKVKIRDNKVAFLGFTRFNNAKRNCSGTTPDNYKKLSKGIMALKNSGFFVILFPHWNREYISYPTPANRELAHKLIDIGADLIVGTHPHIIQGFENYQGKWIHYSLGNFIFNQSSFQSISSIKDVPWLKISYILNIEVNDNSIVAFSIIPIYTDTHHLRLLEKNEKEKFFIHLNSISQILSSSEIFIEKFYAEAYKIREQSKKMIKKQVKKYGIKSVIKQILQVRLQDLRIALYPNLENRWKFISKNKKIFKIYKTLVHKFVGFSIIGAIITLLTMITLGVLLGILKLSLFPTWPIVYISSIIVSFILNNKYIFKSRPTLLKFLSFFGVYLFTMFLGIYLLKFFRMVTPLPNWLLGYLVLPFTLSSNFILASLVLKDRKE